MRWWWGWRGCQRRFSGGRNSSVIEFFWRKDCLVGM
jgi:hypothetical protein